MEDARLPFYKDDNIQYLVRDSEDLSDAIYVFYTSAMLPCASISSHIDGYLGFLATQKLLENPS